MLGTVIAVFRITHPGLSGHPRLTLTLVIGEGRLGMRKWKPTVRMAMMKMKGMRMRMIVKIMIQGAERGHEWFP